MSEVDKQITIELLKEINQGIGDYSVKSDDLEAYIDLFDAERSEKNYDWNSNLFIPEMPSHINTQLSMDVQQYFKTRDFVSVYLQDKSPQAMASSAAAQECINRTLNQRDLYHYPKFCRSKLFTYLNGSSYAICWWDKEIKYINDNGVEVEKNAEQNLKKIIVNDRFMYDILDPRQVISSPEYAYTPQDKRWMAIWNETTFSELEKDAVTYGYKNIDQARALLIDRDSDDVPVEIQSDVLKDHSKNILEHLKTFLKYDWYGKHYIIVDEYDENNGQPISGHIGVDEEGQPLEGSELVEVMATIAKNDAGTVLLRFNVSPYSDYAGRAFRPILRSTCYFHPTEDEGVGDGRYDRDLQIGINDSYNLGNDRLTMATMPTLVTKKYPDDSDDMDMYIAPGHNIQAADPKNDVATLPVSDNITSTLGNIGFLTDKMRQSDAMQLPQLGGLPAASNTATAIASTAANSDIRANYKSMNYEYSFLTAMYWMIQQMTYAFAEEETAYKLMGEDKVFDFDPSLEYFYKPVSQSIEGEASKLAKVDKWNMMMGYIAPTGNIKVINNIIAKVSKLLGDEFEETADTLLEEGDQIQGGQQGSDQQQVSNEQGLPVSATEQQVRNQ